MIIRSKTKSIYYQIPANQGNLISGTRASPLHPHRDLGATEELNASRAAGMKAEALDPGSQQRPTNSEPNRRHLLLALVALIAFGSVFSSTNARESVNPKWDSTPWVPWAPR
jgi:hypothetical protein